MLGVLGENVDGDDPLTFTDSVKEMMDQLGIGSKGRDLYDFGPSLPKNLSGKIDLPVDSPDGSDAQEAWNQLLVPALEDSIADLHSVDGLTILILTSNELATIGSATGTSILDAIELDFGDVSVFEAELQLWLSRLLLMSALDIDLDFDSYTPIEDRIQIQSEVIDANSALGTLIPGHGDALTDANLANRGAIDAYVAASAFIRGEVDH